MINVTFVGNAIFSPKKEWGGSAATSYYYFKAFEHDPDYNVKFVARSDVVDADNKYSKDAYAKIIQGCDLLHVDDTSLLELIYKWGFAPPDVIGPISRSPVKDYSKKKDSITDGWNPIYPLSWFYSAEVIRLNIAEERVFIAPKDKQIQLCAKLRIETLDPFIAKVHMIDHGVDTESMQPVWDHPKKWVLWAGLKNRDAKNYALFEEIVKQTDLPMGFEWKVLSSYTMDEYLAALKETALLVNTSKYESFCCAMFEAKAHGIPCIYKKGLHSGRHESNEIQVEYIPEAYSKAILELCYNRELLDKMAHQSRDYCEQFASLKNMRDSYVKIYELALSKKRLRNIT